MIKVDLTRKGNPVHLKILDKYGIKGVLTVLFLDRLGNERRDLRLVDYLPADQFLIRMAELKKVMVGDEIVVEGSDVSEDKLEKVICTHLGLPEPQPRKKGIFGRTGQII